MVMRSVLRIQTEAGLLLTRQYVFQVITPVRKRGRDFFYSEFFQQENWIFSAETHLPLRLSMTYPKTTAETMSTIAQIRGTKM